MQQFCGETWGEAVRWAAAQLHAVTDHPRLEAELLLAYLSDVPRTRILAHPEAALTSKLALSYVACIDRRASAEPLPYITGHMEFFGLDFRVTPDVLIPRPETELLVEVSLGWLRERAPDRAENSSLGQGISAVDVGTGSGCIAVSLAVQARGLQLYAVDLSTPALWVAKANAREHGVVDRITFLAGSLLVPLPERVDLIVSNPPYVTEAEWKALPASVQREPRGALVSGPDGLDAVRGLLLQATACLQPGGLLLVEIGERQGDAVLGLARAAFPDAEIQILLDLAGKERVLEVRLPLT